MARSHSLQVVLDELGRRIKVARQRAGLTQEAAADLAKMDVKHWQRIEQGDANVTVQTLVRIATALGIDYWDFKAR